MKGESNLYEFFPNEVQVESDKYNYVITLQYAVKIHLLLGIGLMT